MKKSLSVFPMFLGMFFVCLLLTDRCAGVFAMETADTSKTSTQSIKDQEKYSGYDRKTAPSPSLDNQTFEGEIAPQGETQGQQDFFFFKNNSFRSDNCDAYGFGAAPYTLIKEDTTLRFSATSSSPINGHMQWEGTIAGNNIEGTMIWDKKNTPPLKYWFKGTLVQKSAR